MFARCSGLSRQSLWLGQIGPPPVCKSMSMSNFAFGGPEGCFKSEHEVSGGAVCGAVVAVGVGVPSGVGLMAVMAVAAAARRQRGVSGGIAIAKARARAGEGVSGGGQGREAAHAELLRPR